MPCGSRQGNRVLFMVQGMLLAIKEKPAVYRFEVPAFAGTTALSPNYNVLALCQSRACWKVGLISFIMLALTKQVEVQIDVVEEPVAS